MRWLGGITAVGAWVAGLLALDLITSDANLQIWLAIGWAVCLGLVVARWWVFAVPPAFVTALYAYTLLAPQDGCASCEDDIPAIGYIVIAALEVVVAELAVSLGFGLRRSLSAGRGWARRRARARQLIRRSGSFS